MLLFSRVFGSKKRINWVKNNANVWTRTAMLCWSSPLSVSSGRLSHALLHRYRHRMPLFEGLLSNGISCARMWIAVPITNTEAVRTERCKRATSAREPKKHLWILLNIFMHTIIHTGGLTWLRKRRTSEPSFHSIFPMHTRNLYSSLLVAAPVRWFHAHVHWHVCVRAHFGSSDEPRRKSIKFALHSNNCVIVQDFRH